MPYLVTFADNGLSSGVVLVEEQPETLDEGVFYTEVESDFMRFKKDGGTIRPATEAEIEAELAELASTGAAIDNRRQRDMKLAMCDWVVTKALEAGEAVPADWATYRQALRDITTHANWPLLEEADWPVAP